MPDETPAEYLARKQAEQRAASGYNVQGHYVGFEGGYYDQYGRLVTNPRAANQQPTGPQGPVMQGSGPVGSGNLAEQQAQATIAAAEYNRQRELALQLGTRGPMDVSEVYNPQAGQAAPQVSGRLSREEVFRRYEETVASLTWEVDGRTLTSAEMMAAGYTISTAEGMKFIARKPDLEVPVSPTLPGPPVVTVGGQQFALTTFNLPGRRAEPGGALWTPIPGVYITSSPGEVERRIREAGVPEHLTTGAIARVSSEFTDVINRGAEIMEGRYGLAGYWLGQAARGGGSVFTIPTAITGGEIVLRAGLKGPGLFKAAGKEVAINLFKGFEEKPVESTVQLGSAALLTYGIGKAAAVTWKSIPTKPGVEYMELPSGETIGSIGMRSRQGAVESFRPGGSVRIPTAETTIGRVKATEISRGYPSVTLEQYLGPAGAADAPVTAFQSEILARALTEEAGTITREATLIRSARDVRSITSQSGLEAGNVRDILAEVAEQHGIPNPDAVSDAILRNIRQTDSKLFGSVVMKSAAEKVVPEPVLARSVHDIDIMAGVPKEELSTILMREINRAANIDPFAKVEMELRAKTGILSRESAVMQKPSGEIIPLKGMKRHFTTVEYDIPESTKGVIDWHTHPANIVTRKMASEMGEPIKDFLIKPSYEDVASYKALGVKEGRIVTPDGTFVVRPGPGESWAVDDLRWVIRKPATTVEGGRTPYVSLRGGDIVGPSGEKLFDIKSPEAAEGYGSRAGLLRYGLQEEGWRLNTPEEAVRVMKYSEQMSRKAAASMDQVTGLPRTMTTEDLTVISRLTPRHPGQLKSIGDFYTGERGNIALLQAAGRVSEAGKATVALERWLGAWGKDVEKAVRNQYSTALAEGFVMRGELYGGEPAAPYIGLTEIPAAGTALGRISPAAMDYYSILETPDSVPYTGISAMRKAEGISAVTQGVSQARTSSRPSRAVESVIDELSTLVSPGPSKAPTGSSSLIITGFDYSPPESPLIPSSPGPTTYLPPSTSPEYPGVPGYPPSMPPGYPPTTQPPGFPPFTPPPWNPPALKREEDLLPRRWRRRAAYKRHEVFPWGLDASAAGFGLGHVPEYRGGRGHGGARLQPRRLVGYVPDIPVPRDIIAEERRGPRGRWYFKPGKPVKSEDLLGDVPRTWLKLRRRFKI